MPGGRGMPAASSQEVGAMRHVIGFFLALVMAAVLYAGAGWGAGRIEALRAHGVSLATGPGLVALALLAWSAYLAVRPKAAERLSPLSAAHTAELGFRGLLASGILALLGAVMVI